MRRNSYKPENIAKTIDDIVKEVTQCTPFYIHDIR